MKILLVAHLYPPHHRAGVENYTRALASSLAERHQVAVATTRKIVSLQTGTVRDYSVDGIAVHEVVNNLDGDDFEASQTSARMGAAFESIVATERPDLVHFQHLMYWSLDLPARAANLGVPSALTLHDFHLLCPRMGQMLDWRGQLCELPQPERCAACYSRTWWNQPLTERRWIHRLTKIRSWTGLALDAPMRAVARVCRTSGGRVGATDPDAAEIESWLPRQGRREEQARAAISHIDRLIAPANHLRDRFCSWGVPPEKISVVPTGFDALVLPPARDPPGSSTPLRIGFLGTIARHKGVHVLIDAVRRMRAPGADLVVHGPWAGDAAYRKEIIDLTRSCSRVRLGGPLDHDAATAFLTSLDILCVPSLWYECFPLSIVEAFMAGTPVVVSDLGGLAELVPDGRGGRRAAAGDADDWARVLDELCSRPRDLADLAASHGPIVSRSEHVARLEGVYEQLISGAT